MRNREKVVFAVLGIMIFFFSGGVACTYSIANAVDPILAVTLGFLVFIIIGASACTYSNSKIAKKRENQIAQ